MNQFQTFDEVLSALKRRAWLIVLVTFLGCLGSLYYALSQSKVYEATAVVQIEDAGVPERLAGASTAPAEDSARRVRLIEQRLMARDNLIRIMEKHNLFNEVPDQTTNERIFNMRMAVRIEEIVDAARTYAPGGNNPSGLFITVRLSDPQKAADVANDLMYSVIEQSKDRSVARARSTLEFFVTEETRVRDEIEALELNIARFKATNAEQLPAGVSDLRDQLAGLRDSELEIDQQILTIETTSQRLREDIMGQRISLLREQKLLLSERILEIQRQIASAPEVERELSGMERRLDQLQDEYALISNRKAEAAIGQALEDRQQTDRFEVLETALPPENPVSRSRKQLAIMGGVASVLLALVTAFAVELANPAIRSAAQMERMLGIRPVVTIPEVQTTFDHTRRGFTALGWLAGMIALTYAIMRLLGTSPAFGELIKSVFTKLV